MGVQQTDAPWLSSLICEVDMAHLPYMVEKLKTNGSGFSGHKLILIGFDDEKNETYVLDYLWNDVVVVNTDDFKKQPALL